MPHETKKKVLLTGDRPTGPLHLGHLVGSLLTRVELQSQYESYFLIPDYQVLYDHLEDSQKVSATAHNLVLDWLSVGMDPNVATFFRHSQVPAVEGLAGAASTRPQVRLYEGKAGMKQAYALTLELPKGSELLFIGTAPSIRSTYKQPDYYIEARLQAGLTARALIPASALAEEIISRDKVESRRTRMLPADKLKTDVEVIIFGHAIAYLAHAERHPYATIIESATIADEERQRFDLMWELADKS